MNARDVITIKIPYPNLHNDLAVTAHMYIWNKDDKVELVKCQRLKPSMIYNNNFKYYIDEKPDINRNPFRSITRIDCDKLFNTFNVNYDNRLKTNNGICVELHKSVNSKILENKNIESIILDEAKLKRLNSLIT